MNAEKMFNVIFTVPLLCRNIEIMLSVKKDTLDSLLLSGFKPRINDKLFHEPSLIDGRNSESYINIKCQERALIRVMCCAEM